MFKNYNIRIYDEDETNLIKSYYVLAVSFTNAVEIASKKFKLSSDYKSMKTYIYK